MNSHNAGFFYGKGIFSTVAVRNKRLVLWEKHCRRLTANANATGLDLSHHSFEAIKAQIDEQLQKAEVERGRLRITFFDRSGGELWPNGETGTEVSIVYGEEKKLPEKILLGISPFQINTTSPLAGIKSCNYLDNLLALKNAASNGYTEAVRLNENGEVASAVMANIFWVKDGEIFTPALSTGCLLGTTREFVIENLNCCEVKADISELVMADSIFLTSAGVGILQVDQIEEKKFLPLLAEIKALDDKLASS